MPMWTRNTWTFLANDLLGVAILIFALGFFPHKAVLPGLAQWPPNSDISNVNAPFDKVIFMVVDALRSDFVYGNQSGFQFTQSLIRQGAAIPFTGHASPPTITMPRVKAITTGSVPSFIDLILNFAESDTTSTLKAQDSWLAQMRAKSTGNLVMYGDDTWLRLFPDFFARSDGTTSFFVSDFTEVDHNVTRNIPAELKRDDWSVMVMHYLGLDHIGHKTGPQGPNMPAKQTEMDGIVEMIYTALETEQHLEKTLLVLLGDHGMNEAGNHGASSAGETSTALTFISSAFQNTFGGLPCPIHNASDYSYYQTVEQSDIAATLAILLGFPIPRNSVGVVIPQMMNLWKDDSTRTAIQYANAQQIKDIAQATFPEAFKSAQAGSCADEGVRQGEYELACEWQHIQEANEQGRLNTDKTVEILQQFLDHAQSLLSGAASKYNLQYMSIGIGLTLAAFLIPLVLSGWNIAMSGLSGISFTLCVLLYCITMFASSYVEEEHQFWYLCTGAWLTVLAARSHRQSGSQSRWSGLGNIATCLLFGVSRRWNQTGQKYTGESDLAGEIFGKQTWLLWTLVVITYSVVSRRLSRKAVTWGSKQAAILPAIIAASAFLFKLAFTAADAPELLKNFTPFHPAIEFLSAYPLHVFVQITFLGLAHLLATTLFYEKPWQSLPQRQSFLASCHDILTLFLLTQTRTINIPIFLLFTIQAKLLQRDQKLQGLDLTMTSLLMRYSSFFMLGGTNAISSIDLSNAYNGIRGYNVFAVGALTFVSNWAGPIWWTSATYCVLGNHDAVPENHEVRRKETYDRFTTLTLFASASTLAVMLACLVLREHLFIWTVFSPKYLYLMAWTFGQHFVINGLFGTLLLG